MQLFSVHGASYNLERDAIQNNETIIRMILVQKFPFFNIAIFLYNI